MKTSEEVKHLPTIFKQLVTNKSKLKFVRKIRERLISILKPITPPKAKLKNFDYAAVFCRESLKNQKNKLYENALTLLRMCNDALESGKVEQHHINAILVLYGKADQAREEQELISEDRSEIGHNGGSKPKKLPGLVETVKKYKSENIGCSFGMFWNFISHSQYSKGTPYKIEDYSLYVEGKNIFHKDESKKTKKGKIKSHWKPIQKDSVERYFYEYVKIIPQ
jgi:hypothetical protein